MNWVISILSAAVLAIPTASFLAGTKSRRTDAYLLGEAILTSHFLLSSIMLISALLGAFDGTATIALSSAGSFYLAKKREKIKAKKLNNGTIILALLIAFIIFTLVVQGLSPITVTSDGYSRYLPWAKIISETRSIPGVVEKGTEIAPKYLTISSPHLLYGFLAVLFSTFHSYSDGIIAGLPLFFSASAFLFLLLWAEEEKKDSSLFIAPLLLSSYAYILNFHSVLQEVPLFLYFTIGAYFIEKLSKTKNIKTAYLIGAASALSTHTKYNGLIFSIISFAAILYFMRKSRGRTKAAIAFSLFHSLTIVWLIRNYIVFNNPFYRQLYKYFQGKWNYARELRPVGTKSSAIPPWRFLRNLIFEYPAIIPATAGIIAKRKDAGIMAAVLVVILNIAFLPLIGARLLVRYVEPFFGILGLFGAVFMTRAAEKAGEKIFRTKKKAKKTVMWFTIIVTALLLMAVPYAIKENPAVKEKLSKINSEKAAAEFILMDYGRGAILWGELSPALEWYSDSVILTPSDNMFLIANGKAAVPYKETYIKKDILEKMPDGGKSLIITNPDAEDYNQIAHKIGAEYLYDSVYGNGTGYEEVNALMMKDIYEKAEQTPELFTLVYKGPYGAKLWRVN